MNKQPPRPKQDAAELLKGSSLADELISERRAEAHREAVEWVLEYLAPNEKAKVLLLARIEIIAQEAVATSALEGESISMEAARASVLRQMVIRALNDLRNRGAGSD